MGDKRGGRGPWGGGEEEGKRRGRARRMEKGARTTDQGQTKNRCNGSILVPLH